MIYIASDHSGVEMKAAIMDYLDFRNIGYLNFGTDDSSKSVDYPLYAHSLIERVLWDEDNIGILICGTGIGMSIAANRHKGIRCAVVNNGYMAEMTRKHNNANVIALGARLIDCETACQLVQIFLDTEFEGGRHQTRIDDIERHHHDGCY